MPRQMALPPSLAPRLVSRAAAASYICVCPNTFDQMVKEGRMPRPLLLGGKRRAWDVRALDAAVDQLALDCDESPIDRSWEDVDAT
jgi:hypothetical protein